MTDKFLSTPSARRATLNNNLNPPTRKISIHALREEGDHGRHLLINRSSISIHALREEGDQRYGDRILWQYISIHALREEGDRCSCRP